MKNHFNDRESNRKSMPEPLNPSNAPPVSLADGLLQDGLLLLGGRAITGKSWMMLDLAVSVATGTPVWGHFAVPEPQSVLYIALTDSRRRVKHRLEAILPGDLSTDHRLHLLWDFPMLDQGGIEKLKGYIESGRYRLIVIDPLTRLGAYDEGCLQLLRMFEEFKDLRSSLSVCLAAVMTTTRPEMNRTVDCLLDDLWPSQFPPLTAWYLDRGKPVRTVHVRDGDGTSRTLRLHFAGERWHYLSPGADRETASHAHPVSSGK